MGFDPDRKETIGRRLVPTNGKCSEGIDAASEINLDKKLSSMQKEFTKRDVDSSVTGSDQELEIGLNSNQRMGSQSEELKSEKLPHEHKGHGGEHEDYEAEPDLRDLPFTLPNIPRFIVLGLIRAYQATFSRTLPQDTCRFYPSCSHYGYQAIYKYGVLKGGLMAAWRVLRCNPLNKGGFDPVK